MRTEAAVGSPRPMTIYFPSASLYNATLLRPCLQGWPVMLFLHGMPPRQGATQFSGPGCRMTPE